MKCQMLIGLILNLLVLKTILNPLNSKQQQASQIDVKYKKDKQPDCNSSTPYFWSLNILKQNRIEQVSMTKD